MTQRKIAVVLLNLGGPDSLEAVEPFLYNLFSDKDIFKIPFGQKFFAKIIARKRAPKVIEQYKQIGGKSPINEITEAQRSALENALREENRKCDVFTAMRYWHPLSEETAWKIKEGDYDKIVLLSLYPHYSAVTVGSSLNEWARKCKTEKEKQIVIASYHDDENYHRAVNARIDEALARFEKAEDVFILFSAHGVPESLIKKGDPYQKQIIESVEMIMHARGKSNPYAISYQSKVGPVKWIEPSTENKIPELAKAGVKNLLVVPISFVSDHIETLYELKIEYGEIAKKHGIDNYEITRGLNDIPEFINALKNLLIKTKACE